MADPIHVSAGIIVQNGRVLVCQRRPEQAHGGKWEFPGGKREAGESIAACLRRELREELGIEAEIGAEVWRTEYAYADREPILLVFLAVPAYRGALENRVFAALRWVEVSQLEQLDFLAADHELIVRLRSGQIRLS
jgi:8-oxo-dGTP diphosphatase